MFSRFTQCDIVQLSSVVHQGHPGIAQLSIFWWKGRWNLFSNGVCYHPFVQCDLIEKVAMQCTVYR